MSEQSVIEQTPTQTSTALTPAQATTVQNIPDNNNIQTTEAEPAGDILTRVTQKKEVPKTPEEIGGTFKMFDDVTDPVLKERLIAREKERTADYTRKTQELARQREEYERFKRDSQNWTPERIQQELLNNPRFLQAAQRVPGVQNPAGSGVTDEQFSALTPEERNQLLQDRREVQLLKQQNFISTLNQKDALLQTKYGDYDILKVNQGLQDLARMSPIDVREHAYKAIFHDEHVKAAYEMGRQERKELTQTRTQAASMPGVGQALPASDIPTRNKGENDINYFTRLAQRRIDQAKGMAVKR
jgi:hypothetical protein